MNPKKINDATGRLAELQSCHEALTMLMQPDELTTDCRDRLSTLLRFLDQERMRALIVLIDETSIHVA